MPRCTFLVHLFPVLDSRTIHVINILSFYYFDYVIATKADGA